jgi:flagellar basal body-associated protein FliL
VAQKFIIRICKSSIIIIIIIVVVVVVVIIIIIISSVAAAAASTRVYPEVSGLAASSENGKWYSALPLGVVVSLFCESV